MCKSLKILAQVENCERLLEVKWAINLVERFVGTSKTWSPTCVNQVEDMNLPVSVQARKKVSEFGHIAPCSAGNFGLHAVFATPRA